MRQSYFPGFRIAPPDGDRAVSIAGMDRYLVVTGERFNYWLPGVQLPDANGAGGTIPALVRLPFSSGPAHASHAALFLECSARPDA